MGVCDISEIEEVSTTEGSHVKPNTRNGRVLLELTSPR